MKYKVTETGGGYRGATGDGSAGGVRFLQVFRAGVEVASLNLEMSGADIYGFLAKQLEAAEERGRKEVRDEAGR